MPKLPLILVGCTKEGERIMKKFEAVIIALATLSMLILVIVLLVSVAPNMPMLLLVGCSIMALLLIASGAILLLNEIYEVQRKKDDKKTRI